jgi:hypothetical protein
VLEGLRKPDHETDEDEASGEELQELRPLGLEIFKGLVNAHWAWVVAVGVGVGFGKSSQTGVSRTGGFVHSKGSAGMSFTLRRKAYTQTPVIMVMTVRIPTVASQSPKRTKSRLRIFSHISTFYLQSQSPTLNRFLHKQKPPVKVVFEK